ncbi:zinc finger protein 511-like isoform X2 [Pecten maximus]|uniref:zinc finger protein 511-like isoform X2 n=1 Tax=Pecten maximus TaxID=6579 RepID=UPI001459081E|nr:zinc finger protein 511-like isoform X2 [Pecten maximus]
MGMPWQWKVCKRRLVMDCALFEDGNQMCYYPSKHVNLVKEEARNGNPEFLCQLANCGRTFSSHASYESHYGLVHSRVCETCRKNFPTNHLLDLHILEWHDSMFALLSKKQPMFQCLVESCNYKFSTRKERKNHVIKSHKYPSNYRFDQDQRKHTVCDGRQSLEFSGVPVDMTVDRSDAMSLGTEGVNKMEVGDTSQQRRQFSYKVPNNICFGQGTSRAFQRSRSRGRDNKKGQHWYNKNQKNIDTHVDIEKMDLQSLKQALT